MVIAMNNTFMHRTRLCQSVRDTKTAEEIEERLAYLRKRTSMDTNGKLSAGEEEMGEEAEFTSVSHSLLKYRWICRAAQNGLILFAHFLAPTYGSYLCSLGPQIAQLDAMMAEEKVRIAMEKLAEASVAKASLAGFFIVGWWEEARDANKEKERK